MNRPTPNPKIAALIATKNIENIKLAFELADAANCPYLKAFKKKYFGKKVKGDFTHVVLKIRGLMKCFLDGAAKGDFVNRALISWFRNEFNISSYGDEYFTASISSYRKFKNLIDERITAGKTSQQWAIIKRKEDLEIRIEQRFNFLNPIYNDDDIPF